MRSIVQKKTLTIVKYSAIRKRWKKQVEAVLKNSETLYREGFRSIVILMIFMQYVYPSLCSCSLILINLAFLDYNWALREIKRTINFQIIVKSRQDKRIAPSSFHLIWISFLRDGCCKVTICVLGQFWFFRKFSFFFSVIISGKVPTCFFIALNGIILSRFVSNATSMSLQQILIARKGFRVVIKFCRLRHECRCLYRSKGFCNRSIIIDIRFVYPFRNGQSGYS